MTPLVILIWAARVLLAAIFLTAGLIKAGASEGFAITIAAFSILPPTSVTILANLLPWVEILTAIFLLIPRTARIGAALASLILVVFIGALTWALSQGLIVDCGCFGESPPSLTKMLVTLGRNVVLLAIALGLAIRTTHREPSAS